MILGSIALQSSSTRCRSYLSENLLSETKKIINNEFFFRLLHKRLQKRSELFVVVRAIVKSVAAVRPVACLKTKNASCGMDFCRFASLVDNNLTNKVLFGETPPPHTHTDRHTVFIILQGAD